MGSVELRAPPTECSRADSRVVDASPDAGVASVEVVGDFDSTSNHILRDMLTLAATSGWPTVVVDLGAMTFIDANTLGIFVRCQRIAAEHRCRMRFANPHGIVQTVLELTGTFRQLADSNDPDVPAPRMAAT